MAAMAAMALAIAGCGNDTTTATATTGGGADRHEGVLVVHDGEPPRLCRDYGFRGDVIDCVGESLEVVGADLDAIPRLSRIGTVRFAWPAIVLLGTEVDGVLTVTEPTPVVRVRLTEPTDRSVVLDNSGSSAEIQLTPGQDLGLIGPWDRVGPATIDADAGDGRLAFHQPECDDDGTKRASSCIGGYLALDTTDLQPGTYAFTVQGTAVVVEVVRDDDPGATTTDWSFPVEPA